MSQLYYLRVEGVNFVHFIEDTEDLSTIRGGGLLLLNAPQRIESEALPRAGADQITRITSGASQAVFRFRADDPHAVRGAVAAWLRQQSDLRHATFVVDVLPDSDDWPRAKERLLALNRWRQMQQSRLAVPAPNSTRPPPDKGRPYCGIDFVRPAVAQADARNPDKRPVSGSVASRRKYGHDQKQAFYREVLDRAGYPWTAPHGADFAWDFHQIAARGSLRYGKDADSQDRHAHLHDKLAVLYADGNQFSTRQRASCTNTDDQGAWERLVQNQIRARALHDVLERVATDDAWICRAASDGQVQPVIRFETLLWGGDDLLWVAPAWKGWELVQTLFTAARQAQPDVGPADRLTHAAGLVFCHAGAPIHRITKLAKDLAQEAKNATARATDGVAYAVLESFDHLGQELKTARQKQLPAGCGLSELVIRGDDLENLLGDVETMKGREREEGENGFPRGSVYRLLRELRGVPSADGQTRELTNKDRQGFEFWLKRARREAAEIPERFKPSDAGGPSATCRAAWFHLAEIWDYLPFQAFAPGLAPVV